MLTSESFLALICAALIALTYGMFLSFMGYRLFILLLPIWGFFFGFAFGAQTLQALFGEGFLATVTSWIVGFVVAAIFAILSYLFYAVAVALIAGSLGYALGAGIMSAIGLDLTVITWLVGMAGAVIMIVVAFVFNLQKWVIIVATSVMGAVTIAGTFGLLFSPSARMIEQPVQAVVKASPLLVVVALLVAVAGIVVQARVNRFYEIESYNRWQQAAA
jgi:hypothetical protein